MAATKVGGALCALLALVWAAPIAADGRAAAGGVAFAWSDVAALNAASGGGHNVYELAERSGDELLDALAGAAAHRDADALVLIGLPGAGAASLASQAALLPALSSAVLGDGAAATAGSEPVAPEGSSTVFSRLRVGRGGARDLVDRSVGHSALRADNIACAELPGRLAQPAAGGAKQQLALSCLASDGASPAEIDALVARVHAAAASRDGGYVVALAADGGDAAASAAAASAARDAARRRLDASTDDSTDDDAADSSVYYVHMTPMTLAGILVGLLFVMVVIIGLSCLNSVQTPSDDGAGFAKLYPPSSKEY